MSLGVFTFTDKITIRGMHSPAGRKWYVLFDEQYKKVYFRDRIAEISQWEDPRTSMSGA